MEVVDNSNFILYTKFIIFQFYSDALVFLIQPHDTMCHVEYILACHVCLDSETGDYRNHRKSGKQEISWTKNGEWTVVHNL